MALIKPFELVGCPGDRLVDRFAAPGAILSSRQIGISCQEQQPSGGIGAAAVTFAAHLLPHKYGHFGSLTGDESNVGIAKGSDAIEGGCACFAENAERDQVRICYSSRVPRRASELRAASFLGYIPGSAGTVEWLQRQFAAGRLDGDWFRSSVELRAFLGAVAPLQIATRSRRAASLGAPGK